MKCGIVAAATFAVAAAASFNPSAAPQLKSLSVFTQNRAAIQRLDSAFSSRRNLEAVMEVAADLNLSVEEYPGGLACLDRQAGPLPYIERNLNLGRIFYRHAKNGVVRLDELPPEDRAPIQAFLQEWSARGNLSHGAVAIRANLDFVAVRGGERRTVSVPRAHLPLAGSPNELRPRDPIRDQLQQRVMPRVKITEADEKRFQAKVARSDREKRGAAFYWGEATEDPREADLALARAMTKALKTLRDEQANLGTELLRRYLGRGPEDDLPLGSFPPGDMPADSRARLEQQIQMSFNGYGFSSADQAMSFFFGADRLDVSATFFIEWAEVARDLPYQPGVFGAISLFSVGPRP